MPDSDLVRIWNRATTNATPTRPGDAALKDVLLVHGQIMNGGLLSALDYVDYDRIERAAAGLGYLGLTRPAATLTEALRIAFPDGPVDADRREEHTMALPAPALERIEGELEDAYGVDDEALYDAFVRAHSGRPGDFAPA